MDLIRTIALETVKYDRFQVGTSASVLAIVTQISNPHFMLTTLAAIAGITVTTLSAFKVYLEIRIKQKELNDLEKSTKSKE